MANLLSGLQRPTKSKNTLRAESIRVGDTPLGGLLSGLKSYYGVKGAEEDERYLQDYNQRIIDLQQEQTEADAKGKIKGEFLNTMDIINDPSFKETYPPEQQQRFIDFANTRAKSVNTLQGQEEAKALGKGAGQLQTKPQIEQAVYDVKIANEPLLASQKAQATATGKAQAENIESLQSQASKLPELENVITKLSDLGQKATYTYSGRAKDAIQRELGFDPSEGAVARTEYQAVVNNQVLPLLRDTFGAAFTVQEGESLKATLGDVNKSPQEKEAVLRAFIEQKRRNIQSTSRQVGIKQEISFDDLWGE